MFSTATTLTSLPAAADRRSLRIATAREAQRSTAVPCLVHTAHVRPRGPARAAQRFPFCRCCPGWYRLCSATPRPLPQQPYHQCHCMMCCCPLSHLEQRRVRGVELAAPLQQHDALPQVALPPLPQRPRQVHVPAGGGGKGGHV